MKMVQLGLITPLKSQFSRNYLFTRQTIRLKDGVSVIPLYTEQEILYRCDAILTSIIYLNYFGAG